VLTRLRYDVVMKAITRRADPRIPPNGAYKATISRRIIRFWKGSAFPSGHALDAVFRATVFAEVQESQSGPYVAYTLATAIKILAQTTGSHFPSDDSSAPPQVSRLRNLTCFATKVAELLLLLDGAAAICFSVPRHNLLEISVEKAEAAAAEKRGGATTQIELCAQLRLGGLRPSEGLMQMARTKLALPMLR